MFSALFFLQWQSLKNQLWQRARRLRNPRYLFGAVFGLAYFALFFGRSFRQMGADMRIGTAGIPATTWEFFAALALLAVALLAWLIPHQRAALVFSEAEIAFLFPAPVRRQTLIHYKLVRSQLAILFTVGFLTLISRWSGGVGGALMRAAGWWILLSTINLHLLGSSFARTILLERGVSHWQRRGLVLALLIAVAVAGTFWVRSQMPPAGAFTFESFGDYIRYINEVARTPPAVYLLAPFRWVARPFLASGNPHAFFASLGPALVVLLLHYFWVTRSDVAFEEASIEASQRQVARAAALREGRGLNARPHKRRRAPFRLSPTGPPAVAILWKNLLSAGQVFSSRYAVVMLVWAVFLGVSLSHGGGQRVWPQIIAYMAVALAGWSVVLGPQVVRQDFRQDLAAADLLKTYPLRGWQVALGELLTPTVILTLLQWAFLILAVTLWDKRPDEDGTSLWEKHVAWGLAAAILAPMLNLVSLIVPNSAAVLLPAWFATPTTPGTSRGVEVFGQRFIFMIGQFIVLLAAAAPVALTLFVVYVLAAEPLLGPHWAWPASALLAAIVCAVEAAGGLLLLGHWFENFDLSAEKPA